MTVSYDIYECYKNGSTRFNPIIKKLVAAKDAYEVRELALRIMMYFFCSPGHVANGAFNVAIEVHLRLRELIEDVAHEESSLKLGDVVSSMACFCKDW